MSEVAILFFQSGLELIGTVESETDTQLSVDLVLGLSYGMSEPTDGQKPTLNFQFVPFAPLSQNRKVFFKAGLAGRSSPKQGLLNAYQQATGKVLTPPSAAASPELILS